MDFFIRLLSLIPHIIILIAVILYVSKHSEPEGILMLIGAITAILVSLIYTVGIPYLVDMTEWQSSFHEYIGIISGVATLGALAFAIGLLMLIQKVIAKRA